jgi:hypothetical protein
MDEKKIYRNSWLVDSEYLKQQNFEDPYYFESLCYHINSFIKNTPIPVITEYIDKRIVFSVGKIRKDFKINIDYSYYDFLCMVKKWIGRFYPKYEVEYEVEVPLSHEEMISKVKNEGLDLNDVVHMKKSQVVKERAVIEKAMFVDDQFIINKNDKRFICSAGTIKNPMSMTEFKKKLMSIRVDIDRKKFIDENSTILREIVDQKDIIIEYHGKQMLNFFKINYDELIKFSSGMISPFVYRFGRFIVKFSSQSLMDDCLKYLSDRKMM